MSSTVSSVSRTGARGDLIRRGEVQSMTSLSASSIYRLVGTGMFPRPIRVSPNRVAWVREEIHSWIEQRKVSRWQSPRIPPFTLSRRPPGTCACARNRFEGSSRAESCRPIDLAQRCGWSKPFTRTIAASLSSGSMASSRLDADDADGADGLAPPFPGAMMRMTRFRALPFSRLMSAMNH
jgi:prophage regulatory protein